MLHTNNADKVKSQLNNLKYTNQETNDIWFLITISNPSKIINNLPVIKNLQKNVKLSSSQISQWAKINNDKNILKIWNWKISTTAKEAIAKDYTGKKIGDYIKHKEQELYNGKK